MEFMLDKNKSESMKGLMNVGKPVELMNCEAW